MAATNTEGNMAVNAADNATIMVINAANMAVNAAYMATSMTVNTTANGAECREW